MFFTFTTLLVALLLSEPPEEPNHSWEPPRDTVSNTVRPVNDQRYGEETLWMARAIMSETDRPREMKLVAWVIRNRMEHGHYPSRARNVVLQPKQFSAFNPGMPRRAWYLSLERKHLAPGAMARWKQDLWHVAIMTAEDVYSASPEENPLPGVLHFYSPVSMEPRGHTPHWAQGIDPVLTIEDRFRFFANVNREHLAEHNQSG